jgi:hypothetical protein
MLSWLARCTPVLSAALLVYVTYRAFTQPFDSHKSSPSHNPLCRGQKCPARLSASQTVWVIYTLILHISLVVVVPQLCISLHFLTKSIKAVRRNRAPRPSLKGRDSPSSETDSYTDSGYTSDGSGSCELPGEIALLLPSQTSLEAKVIHAIILPNYSEELDTLRETLSVLASHERAAFQYEVSWSPTRICSEKLTRGRSWFWRWKQKRRTQPPKPRL